MKKNCDNCLMGVWCSLANFWLEVTMNTSKRMMRELLEHGFCHRWKEGKG
jgi:hypothetical protein